MATQTLFLMFGYPGSGKTAFAKQLSQALDIRRVSYDELRNKMWPTSDPHDTLGYQALVLGALDYTTEQLLTTGTSVIYDVNNNRRQERVATRVLAGRCQSQTIVIWMQTPLVLAHQREATRLLTENHRMTPEKYQGLVDAMEEPDATETVIRIDGQQPFAAQLQSFRKQLDHLGEIL